MFNFGDNRLVVLIANAVRLRAIRDARPFPQRILYFSDSNLESAFGSIRAHEGCVVALDSPFAQTSAGREFADRLQSLSIEHSDMQVVSFEQGLWSMRPLATPSARPPAPPVVNVNTRRVPRFSVLDPLSVVVNGKPMSLVDLSVKGAQIVSKPQLRPKQRLSIVLRGEGDAVQMRAKVAWSAFEMSKEEPVPFYRAGLEFIDTPPPMLEEFCRRYCSDEPLPLRF